jgi:phosphatidate phosphatase LPIN
VSDELDDVAVPFPPLRATSEPPPDLEDQQHPSNHGVLSLDNNLPVQEYSWEWGAFPQPSPMNPSFGRRFEGGSGSRINLAIGKGKLRLSTLNPHGQPIEEDVKSHRSRSVPPELEGSPTMKRREISNFEDDDYNNRNLQQSTKEDEQGGFGFGGRLTSSRTDPTQFTVYIEKRKVGFELSLVSPELFDPLLEEMDQRGRRNENSPKNRTKPFHGLGEVEAARIFNQGKVSYRHFLDDEPIVRDARLVIRWAGDQ